VDATPLEFDGGDLGSALERIQSDPTALAVMMKALDRRLLLQEEKLQSLADNSRLGKENSSLPST
jgi:hypothetical protein